MLRQAQHSPIFQSNFLKSLPKRTAVSLRQRGHHDGRYDRGEDRFRDRAYFHDAQQIEESAVGRIGKEYHDAGNDQRDDHNEIIDQHLGGPQRERHGFIILEAPAGVLVNKAVIHAAQHMRNHRDDLDARVRHAGQQPDHYTADWAGERRANGGEELARVGDYYRTRDRDGDAGQNNRQRYTAEGGRDADLSRDNKGFLVLSTVAFMRLLLIKMIDFFDNKTVLHF